MYCKVAFSLTCLRDGDARPLLLSLTLPCWCAAVADSSARRLRLGAQEKVGVGQSQTRIPSSVVSGVSIAYTVVPYMRDSIWPSRSMACMHARDHPAVSSLMYPNKPCGYVLSSKVDTGVVTLYVDTADMCKATSTHSKLL